MGSSWAFWSFLGQSSKKNRVAFSQGQHGGLTSSGNPAILYKTRGFPSLLRNRFGFIHNFLHCFKTIIISVAPQMSTTNPFSICRGGWRTIVYHEAEF